MGLILDGTTGISASGNIYGANIIVTNNFTPAALSVVGNVQGNVIIGNGAGLTSVVASSATTAATVTTAAQPNITSVGTLTSVTSSGLISTTGNVSGNVHVGNGAGLTSLVGSAVTGTVPAATIAATVTTAAQPNITSVGTLSSLSVTANVTGGNVTTGIISATGGITTTNGITATGNITGGNISGTNLSGSLTTATQANITTVGTLGSLTVTANVTGGNLVTSGTAAIGGFTISGNTITSAGPSLTIDPNASGGIDGNVVIQGNLVVNGNMTYINSNNITTNDLTINMANNAATATAANGGGIGVGPAGAEYISLTYNSVANIWVASNGLSVQGAVTTAGNVTGGNLITSGQLTATGNVSGNVHVGNGAGLTSLVGSAVTGTVPAATIAATVTTAAQPNITSTGTLTSLTSSGLISTTGNISGGNLIVTGIVVDNTGNLDLQTTATNGNINLITQGTGIVATTANISGGNIIGTLNGSGANVTSISATNISSGTLAQARLANSAVTLGSTALTLGATVTTVAGLTSVTSTTFVGALTGAATTAGSATTAATVTTAAQPNITSVGTLSSLTVSGALSSGAHTITGTPATAIINGGTTGTGNIGATGATFNTVFAKATTAQYADLAEKYSADAEYAPGTVLSFGGDSEVTVSLVSGDRRVAGVVSTDPGFLMNEGLTGTTATVALTGRVPTRVTGTVRKGDLMVSNGDGSAKAEADPQVGAVIGKALENFDGETGTIEVVIGRL